MAHAELCPVCKGAGRLPQEYGESSSIPLWRTCHGCGGMGWVPVPDEVRYESVGPDRTDGAVNITYTITDETITDEVGHVQ